MNSFLSFKRISFSKLCCKQKAVLYLPARSDLDVDGGLTVPEDGDIFLWEMNNGEVSRRPNEHPLLPVSHAGWILQTGQALLIGLKC